MSISNGVNNKQNNTPPLLLEAPKKFPVIWVVAISVAATAVVVGGGVYLWQSLLTEPVVDTSGDQIVQFNCEQSGGAYSNQNCNCSAEDSYEDSTGYCITADGSPGGELGEQAKKLLEAEMKEGYVYTNANYGFSLTFPAAWGNIKVSGPSGVIPAFKDQITLTSGNDEDRYLYINVVNLKNKNDAMVVDAPMTHIKDNNYYAFYFDGSGGCAGKPGCEDQKWFDIWDEVQEIIKTFTVRNLEYESI